MKWNTSLNNMLGMYTLYIIHMFYE